MEIVWIMDNEIFLRLLRLSFDERNTQILKKFTEEKYNVSFKNKLNLVSSIASLYAIVIMELEESSDIIAETAFHVVKTEYLISNYAQIRKACASAFMERAAEIEEIFLQNVVFLETEAQNTESLNPYAPLADTANVTGVLPAGA